MLIQTSVIILWYLALSFILVLPGAAIDRPMRIVDAWHELRGNSWRCIGTIIIVIGFPFSIVDNIVSLYWSGLTLGTFTVVGTELSSELRTPMNLEDGIFAFSMTALNFFVTALAITALSIFYRHIVGMDAPEGGAQVFAKGP